MQLENSETSGVYGKGKSCSDALASGKNSQKIHVDGFLWLAPIYIPVKEELIVVELRAICLENMAEVIINKLYTGYMSLLCSHSSGA